MATYGLIELANRRSHGVKPTMVFVTVACPKKLSADWWKFSDQHPEVWIAPHEAISAIDLFPLTGLPVLMHAEQWTSQADDLFHALQAVAGNVTVICDAMDEGGFKWRKGGDMAFLGEPYQQEAAA